MQRISNRFIVKPDSGGDGIKCFGGDSGENIIVENCVVDFSRLPIKGGTDYEELDECLSTIHGARVYVNDCTFRGSTKGALCGNGQYPELDAERGAVFFNRCTLEECGRRLPEAQDGVSVTLRNCIIRNWGKSGRFSVRCFGAWAHHGGKITAVNCTFEQDSFIQTGIINLIVDIANHVGQAVNDRGLFGLTLKDFLPGVCRGLIATDGGSVRAIGCKKNKWWIRIEGRE